MFCVSSCGRNAIWWQGLVESNARKAEISHSALADPLKKSTWCWRSEFPRVTTFQQTCDVYPNPPNYDDVCPNPPIASGLQFEQFLLQVKEAFGLGDTARLWVLYNTSQGCSMVTSEPVWQDASTPTFQIRPACVRSNRIGQAARLHIDSQASLWSSGASSHRFTSFTLAKLCVFTLIRPSIFT
jgi:hypothetical protein